MRYLLLFLFLPLLSYGQRQIPPTLYELRMDSLAMSHFKVNYIKAAKKSRILTLKPIRWVKFTVKPRVNRSLLSKFNMDELFNNGLDAAVSDFLGDLDASDYLSLVSYDVRAKFYINQRLTFLTRFFVTGVESDTYYYSIGLTMKLY